MRPLASALLLIALPAALPGRATAQGAAPVARLALRHSVGDSLRPAPPTALAPVTVRGAPRSFQVVAVPVPSQLPAGQPARYRIATNGVVPILGPLAGELPPAAGTRTLLLTVGVPARARAGDLSVAAVRFANPAGPALEVPILVSVAAVQQIEITVQSTLHAARVGTEAAVGFALTNAGNAPDTVTLAILAPPSWTVLEPVGNEPMILPTHGRVDGLLRLRIPPSAESGTERVRLLARAGGRVVASAELSIEVLGRGAATPAQAGPVLTMGAIAATGPWNGASAALTAELQGALSEQVQLYARATTLTRRAGPSTYGFATAGVYATPPTVRLSAPTWQAGLGLTGTTLSDLSGVNVAGRGFSGALERGRLRANLLIARPDYGSEADSGSLVGARVNAALGPAVVTTAYSNLSERGAAGRQLEALSVGAEAPAVLDGVLGGEIARRRYAGGTGFGWATTYERRTPLDALHVRLTHAPGGSGAYARATDDLAVSGSRALRRNLAMNASYWRSRDDGRAAFGTLTTDGWTLGAHIQTSASLGLGLDWRRAGFDAAGTSGRFGSSESVLTGSARYRRGSWYADGGLTVGRTSRTTTTPSGASFRAVAPQSGLRGALGLSTLRGTLEATARLDRSSRSVGQFPIQGQFGLRADRIPLARIAEMPLYLAAGVDRYTWFGDRAGATAVRAGVTADLPGGLAISMSAERNPFFVGSDGRQGWIAVFKVTHATRLPRPVQRYTRGRVYDDRNGNGVRDPGEPGLPGVVLHRGSESAVTALDGSYRFLGMSPNAPTLDPRSLPNGVIAGPARPDRPGELPVVRVASVAVQLVPAPTDTGRIAPGDLARAIVMARDSQGRTWVARMVQPGRAVFDALPPGRYSVELDLADVGQPLRTSGAGATFLVGSGPVPEIRIELHARPIRLRPLPNDDESGVSP